MNIDSILDTQADLQTSRLLNLLNKNTPVVIFGVGNLGKKIGGFLQRNNNNVIAFVDNNEKKWGTEFLSRPVVSPASVNNEIKSEAIWLVAVWSPGHSYIETRQKWLSMGIKNIFHASELMLLYPNALLPYLHFQTPEYFRKHRQQLTTVYNHLSDEESKRQYLSQLDYRVNLKFEAIPIADNKNQYFPPDIVFLSDEEVFLDAGAYDGDTLNEFIHRTDSLYSKYLALEPDPVNYKKLVYNTSNIPSNKVELFPYAVGAENTILKFNATGGEGAGLSEVGSENVECKRIDDYFFQYTPTYLKFDIEGAELDALKGAEQTIKTHLPKLAVCLYHLPDDIWTIPLKIMEFSSNYNLYVRTHDTDGFEFVLYAVPRN